MTKPIETTLVTKNPDLSLVLDFARRLHAGVPYGQSDMHDQVLRVAEIICGSTGGDFIETAAALMHKALEAKRTVSGRAASYDDLEKLIGRAGARAVRELQDYNDVTDNLDQSAKISGAAKLGQIAKAVLMAEKIANFETSMNNPNPAKPPEWHLNYFKTRIEIGRAAKDADEKLAALLEKTYAEGLKAVTRPAAPSPAKKVPSAFQM